MGRDAVTYLRADESVTPPAGLTFAATIVDPQGERLGEALGLIAQHHADALFVQRLSAAAGSLGELTRLLDWLEAGEADLISAQPPLDTGTRAGQRTAMILREVERWGREPEHPRTPRGRPGLTHTSPEVAERIAELRAQGVSLHEIARRLNHAGIATPRGGAQWRASSVQSAIGYRRPRPPAPGAPNPGAHKAPAPGAPKPGAHKAPAPNPPKAPAPGAGKPPAPAPPKPPHAPKPKPPHKKPRP